MCCCPHCNSKVPKKNKFCPQCGFAVDWKEENKIKDAKSAPKVIIVLLIVVILLLVVVLGSLYLGDGPDLHCKTNETITEESRSPMAFSDDPEAISVASQSVVKLVCYDKNGELSATGSGFACFASNVIVTNYHVIEGLVYSIEASAEDEQTFEISHILAVDEEKDIAILATKASHNLAVLQPGNSTGLQKGEKVVAIGSPLGLLNSVSTGVFSGYVNDEGIDVLQFTASISSGSSGGALFNDAGEVLGVTFASYESGQNLNLAIPIEEAMKLFNSRDYAVKVQDWYQEKNSGYEYFLNSQFIDYKDLISNPKAYHNSLISVVGYVVDGIKGFPPNPNKMYLIPTKEHKSASGVSTEEVMKAEGCYQYWQNTPFEQSNILSCKDDTRSIEMLEYVGSYVIVTGIFTYEPKVLYNFNGSITVSYSDEYGYALMDVLYIGEG